MKNNQGKKVLVLGSGPIVIGQAAEFDYSGTQACRALKEEGCEVILANSNPATIMTDTAIADRVYIEPLTPEWMESLIEKERPDALLANVGGQTGLNLAMDLAKAGVLDKYEVEMLGTSIEGIYRGEDREAFRALMQEIGEPIIESQIVNTVEDGQAFAARVGYPVVVRPAYTLGGSGGGIAKTEKELLEILPEGLQRSPVTQCLVERAILGWKEVEYEIMRDAKGNRIVVCNMENVDPVGIHTGDSIVVAPSQTLSDTEYYMLRTASFHIVDAVGVIGGCNVQFALHPETGEYAVIEVNPRVSRSSALASKATGYPIAKVATKLALGYRLADVQNSITKKTTAFFEPALDYIVVKIPKWPFDKFPVAKRTLGTRMMATGESMSIGANFSQAMLKGIRSIDPKRQTLTDPKLFEVSFDKLKQAVAMPNDERLFHLAELIRRRYGLERLEQMTGIMRFFLAALEEIVQEEEALREQVVGELTAEKLMQLKRLGFSDAGIAQLLETDAALIRQMRKENKIRATFKMVDTCAGEFEAVSPYFYSTYEEEDEGPVTDRKKIVVLGSGPIRIGQGIEFDYASVHAMQALERQGYETIMINCNPETVSTDFDLADRLYFEPITLEEVMNVIEKEQPEGVMVQFGGQTAIDLVEALADQGVKIFGSSQEAINLAEERKAFDQLLEELGLPRPKAETTDSFEEGLAIAKDFGYPVLARPSYVIGGQGMAILANEEELRAYLDNFFTQYQNGKVQIDQYIQGKELEVDVISDGKDCLIPAIMTHLEPSGVHSGDSITILPSPFLDQAIIDQAVNASEKLAAGLKAVGFLNIQMIWSDQLYVIEANPRASRTLPILSKTTGVPMTEIAIRVMLGENLKDMNYGTGLLEAKLPYAVKVPVFSMEKLPGAEVMLGPEMRSTGEVLGLGATPEEAMRKGMVAAGVPFPKEIRILAMVRDVEKPRLQELLKGTQGLKVHWTATGGTAKLFEAEGIACDPVEKIQKSDELLNEIRQGDFDWVLNLPTKGNDATRDGFLIRRATLESGKTLFTSFETFETAFAQWQQAEAEKRFYPLMKEAK